ncbi:MAG: hypothetical protein VB102_13230 [Paludibacter sp.]|nr:hypothetical protein [Paludibacter sp.]
MKSIKIWMLAVISVVLIACDPNEYLTGLYVEPDASFEINKEMYDVFESVKFTNKGAGQAFVVYPGDEGHVYGKAGSTGFTTASDGTFSYAYTEAGVYNAVWIASSMSETGERILSVDSVKVNVVAQNSGLDKFQLYNVYKMTEYTGNVFFSPDGQFISEDTLMCPIMFASWRNSSVNSIKAKQLIKFELASTLSKFYWINPLGEEKELISLHSGSRIVEFVQGGQLKVQKFKAKTNSGFFTDYYVAPVMIPQFTSFKINGVTGTITRDIAYYNIFNVTVNKSTLGDLSSLKPEFVVMNDDVNLLDGTNCKVSINGVNQVSATSVVDFSKGAVTYQLDYTMMGESNSELAQQAIVKVILQ